MDRGVAGIEEFCRQRGYALQKVFTDKMSGKNFDRPRYIVLKEDVLRAGDTLIVYELDRLGRNKAEISKELAYFKEHGIRVMFLDIPTTTIDYGDADNGVSALIMETVNNILIELLSMIAQTENERRIKRQMEGMAAMKVRGEWDKFGRPRKMSKSDFAKAYKRVEAGEIGSLALMRELGLQHDTYYRYVREYKAAANTTAATS
jgi:DNA invertase Pin-like site-specific DNA recombinase